MNLPSLIPSLGVMIATVAVASFSPEEESRDLGMSWNGRGGGGRGFGHHGGGGGGEHKGNYTNYLQEKCTNASIVCDDVAPEDLADCGNYTWGHGFHHDDGADRALQARWEGDERIEDIEIRELRDFLEGVDLMIVEASVDSGDEIIEKGELRGSSTGGNGGRDLHRNRPHGGGGGDERWGHGGGGGHWADGGSSWWGNLTDAEVEAIKMKRLLCRCCYEDGTD